MTPIASVLGSKNAYTDGTADPSVPSYTYAVQAVSTAGQGQASNPIALVKVDGLHYSAAAYLMEGDCSPIDSDGPGDSMKITLAAIDSVGRRVDPVLDSSPEESPWTGLVKLAVPTSFDIHLVATGNITRTQAKDLGAVFIGCMLAPVDTDKQPTSLQVADIGAGKGKVECRVRK